MLLGFVAQTQPTPMAPPSPFGRGGLGGEREIKAGDSLDLFLEHFPTVQGEQAIAILELVKEMLAS